MEIDTKRVKEFIKRNPDYAAILERAASNEDQNLDTPHYLGWEWYNVEAYPARLMHLVVNGLARVNFKSNRSTCYLLKDREAVKQALARGYQ